MASKRDRGEDIKDLLEVLTQEYFEKIAARIAPNYHLKEVDLFIIRATLGPITYHEFTHYVESVGYTLEANLNGE